MTAFIIKLILATLCIIAGRVIATQSAVTRKGASAFSIIAPKVSYGLSALLVLLAIVGTSLIRIPSGSFATLKRNYMAASLPPGRIVALDGELGPQARILTAGFHFSPLLTLLNDIDIEEVFIVPPGMCAVLSAKDGLPLTSGDAFAPLWTDDKKMQMANDASYFLTEGGGFRGQQSTVLFPGAYTLNPHLWGQPELVPSTIIEQGTVGVIKAFVRGPVDFGPFKRELSPDGKLIKLTGDVLPKGSAAAWLVPVGNVGVWEEPLPNGMYFINPKCYVVTKVPTIAMPFVFKGGYTQRKADLEVDDKGQIKQTITSIEVPVDQKAADGAIPVNIEGWEIHQEMRALVQINPSLAPYVVASLGLLPENTSQILEDRVVVPILRSVTRNIAGGATLRFETMVEVTDASGKVELDETGQPKTKTTWAVRPVKVLDFIENRSTIEQAIEDQAHIEALKEGVDIMEIRLANSDIPAELLAARKREQLAQQLTKSWQQEELAQRQRQLSESAKAEAEQQTTIVQAKIQKQAALEKKEARETDGQAEEMYMTAVARGQKAQMEVLGEAGTLDLQKTQMVLKAITDLLKENPQAIDVLRYANKFVPTVVVNGGEGGGGLAGAAALLGAFQNREVVPGPQDIPQQKVATE